MRISFRFWITGFLFLGLFSVVALRGDDDLDKIRQQRVENLLPPAKSPAEAASALQRAEGWAKSQLPDGSWSDIDYADQTRGGWKALGHLSRTSAMADAYVRGPATDPARAAVRPAILRAFQFWTQKDLKNPNWWNNDIGAPLDLERIMLVMGPDMDDATRAGGLKILDRLHPQGTGQNLVWETGIQLDKGLLTGDAALVRASRDVIFGELKIARSEGIQPDFSFHQHGPQQQMGNFGLAYAVEMVGWANVFRGTSMGLSETQLGVLRDYLVKGEAPMIWRGVMDVGSCGRQLFPGVAVHHGESVLGALRAIVPVDSAHAGEYQAAAALAAGTLSVDAPGARLNIDYYTSDYIVHRRSDFAAYLKMCSSRVIGTEKVNSENLLGRYLADGALWLYESGHEEEDVFPFLDWRRIPGVTCAQDGPTLAPAGKMQTDFAGGVSDGVNGAAGLDYNRDGVTAKKSWFFFDGRILCLGAGITGTTDAPGATSLDQRFSPDAVEIRDASGDPGPSAVPAPLQERPGVSWICAGTRGYVFAQPQAVWVGTATQKGSWNEVYTAGSSAPVAKDIFSVWISHGVRPQAASYVYTLLPATTPAQVKAYSLHPGIEILSNTTAIQAARDAEAHLVEAIFYAPGEFQENGRTIAADQSCALLLHEDTGKITVADPTEKESQVNITLAGASRVFPFPVGDQAGISTGD
jgi:chondroitin AC lyase